MSENMPPCSGDSGVAEIKDDAAPAAGAERGVGQRDHESMAMGRIRHRFSFFCSHLSPRPFSLPFPSHLRHAQRHEQSDEKRSPHSDWN